MEKLISMPNMDINLNIVFYICITTCANTSCIVYVVVVTTNKQTNQLIYSDKRAGWISSLFSIASSWEYAKWDLTL